MWIHFTAFWFAVCVFHESVMNNCSTRIFRHVVTHADIVHAQAHKPTDTYISRERHRLVTDGTQRTGAGGRPKDWRKSLSLYISVSHFPWEMPHWCIPAFISPRSHQLRGLSTHSSQIHPHLKTIPSSVTFSQRAAFATTGLDLYVSCRDRLQGLAARRFGSQSFDGALHSDDSHGYLGNSRLCRGVQRRCELSLLIQQLLMRKWGWVDGFPCHISGALTRHKCIIFQTAIFFLMTLSFDSIIQMHLIEFSINRSGVHSGIALSLVILTCGLNETPYESLKYKRICPICIWKRLHCGTLNQELFITKAI